jgi:prophage antirepressor-like protein
MEVMGDKLSLVLAVPPELSGAGVEVRLAGTRDGPLFCLADVCRVLGNANPSQVAARLDGDEKTTLQIVEGGPGHLFVTEPGLFQIILTSRAANARPFQRWVFHDVLPSIRKHGCYPPRPAGPPPTVEEILLAQCQVLVEQRRQLASVQAQAGQAREVAGEALDAAQQAGHVAQAALDAHSGNHGYYAVLGYARLRGVQMDLPTASRHGRALAATCRGLGVRIGTVRDPRFGEVNTYPETILCAYFDEQAIGSATPHP